MLAHFYLLASQFLFSTSLFMRSTDEHLPRQKPSAGSLPNIDSCCTVNPHLLEELRCPCDNAVHSKVTPPECLSQCRRNFESEQQICKIRNISATNHSTDRDDPSVHIKVFQNCLIGRLRHALSILQSPTRHLYNYSALRPHLQLPLPRQS